MKIFNVIFISFIVLSIVLILLTSYSIINTYVSLKYEIEPFGQDGYGPISIARDYVLQLISTYKFFLCYILISTVLMIISFIRKK